MDNRIRLFKYLIVLASLAVTYCTPTPTQNPFQLVKALPADGKVHIQWWLDEDTIFRYASSFSHVMLMKETSGGKFEVIQEFGPLWPPRQAWCFTDSNLTNSQSYRYVLHAVFAILEDPLSEGYSETLTVIPQSGLADPRPDAVEGLHNAPLKEDTVRLTWSLPTKTDSLYYLLWSPDSGQFHTYYVNMDNAGHDWAPDEEGVYPVRFDSTTFTFLYDRNGDTCYYRIYTFRDSILSYPSEVLKIAHTWQPSSGQR